MSSGTEPGRLIAFADLHSPRARWNLSPAVLCEEVVRREEGILSADGSLVCRTGRHTGRSPNDKFFVREPSSERDIAWGATNHPMAEEHFETLERDILDALDGRDLFVQDCAAGADPEYRLPVRVITEYAWHSLFARNLLIADRSRRTGSAPLTIVALPSFRADPARHGTNSDVVIALHLAKRLVLIGGTSYAGEIKKAVFSALNFLLPFQGVLPMHCSANIGLGGDVALFFGLSGTGKTTLSSDPERSLIGDDEHGWSARGVFNFEGGCYAKTIRLKRDDEPAIDAATRRFGTVLENVVVDTESRELDLNDDRWTENTRAAYPLEFVGNAVPSGQGGHPGTVIMLTADAFGVLPPIARLSPAAAQYHFLSGYTAKVAGTEKGVTEPKATFSSCFGAPFLPLAPSRYAEMLGERVARHNASVWLINTGWTGGPYGVGSRIKIVHTRAMVRAVLSGALDGVTFRRDDVINLERPLACPGVPPEVLDPRRTWATGERYDEQARRLARMFADNFESFAPHVPADVRAAGPRA